MISKNGVISVLVSWIPLLIHIPSPKEQMMRIAIWLLAGLWIVWLQRPEASSPDVEKHD